MIPSLLKELVRTRNAAAPDPLPFTRTGFGGLARPLPKQNALRARPRCSTKKRDSARQLQFHFH